MCIDQPWQYGQIASIDSLDLFSVEVGIGVARCQNSDNTSIAYVNAQPTLGSQRVAAKESPGLDSQLWHDDLSAITCAANTRKTVDLIRQDAIHIFFSVLGCESEEIGRAKKGGLQQNSMSIWVVGNHPGDHPSGRSALRRWRMQYKNLPAGRSRWRRPQSAGRARFAVAS